MTKKLSHDSVDIDTVVKLKVDSQDITVTGVFLCISSKVGRLNFINNDTKSERWIIFSCRQVTLCIVKVPGSVWLFFFLQISPSEEKTIKDFEVPASGSQSSRWKSSLEFAPQSQVRASHHDALFHVLFLLCHLSQMAILDS